MPDYEPLPKTSQLHCQRYARASCRSSCALAGVDLGLPVYGRSWAAPDEPLRRSPEGAPCRFAARIGTWTIGTKIPFVLSASAAERR
jgi:hypothetical protein